MALLPLELLQIINQSRRHTVKNYSLSQEHRELIEDLLAENCSFDLDMCDWYEACLLRDGRLELSFMIGPEPKPGEWLHCFGINEVDLQLTGHDWVLLAT